MRLTNKQQQKEKDVAYLKSRFSDPSMWGVIAGNVISMVLAITQGWELAMIMWIYWGQSVIIGIANVVRMLSLKSFTTEGMKMNDAPVPETQAAKRQVAIFFAVHYGGFHAAYFAFLWQEQPLSLIHLNEAILMMLALSAFVGSHSFSLMHNFAADFKQQKPNLGTLMFYPYLRIIPMHLAIVFGGLIGNFGLLIFMGLKTLADAGTHMVEHHLFQKPADIPVLKD